jgi:hypothetical protein
VEQVSEKQLLAVGFWLLVFSSGVENRGTLIEANNDREKSFDDIKSRSPKES